MTFKTHRRDAQIADLPRRFEDSAALEAFLSHPSQALVDDLAELEGDILILGAGGKMGPTLARLARNAAPQKRILAVARFTEPGLGESLHSHGVETISCDLLDRASVERLPRVANVVFMAGRKFGASQNAALTWAMNVYMPAIVAETFCCFAHHLFFKRKCLSIDAAGTGWGDRIHDARAGWRVCAVLPGT